MRIELDRVRFSYPRKNLSPKPLFTELGLTVAPGESVALLGREGAGKSTLLRLIDGLLLPDSGRVTVDGVDTASPGMRFHEVRGGIGLAFQFPEQQFFCETVEEELVYFFKNHPAEPKPSPKETEETLLAVGLSPELFLSRSPFALSMGEARRLMLATLMLSSPRLLLLDELVAGLDASGSGLVLSVLGEMLRRGTTLVLVSHDMDFLAELATRVLVLEEGSVALDTSAREFFTSRDLSAGFGYRMPQVSVLADRLRSEGLSIPDGVYRFEDLRKRLESIRNR